MGFFFHRIKILEFLSVMIPLNLSEPKFKGGLLQSGPAWNSSPFIIACEMKNGCFLPGRLAVPGISGTQGLNHDELSKATEVFAHCLPP